jgi:hypothetical protein
VVPKITVGAGLRGALDYDQSPKDGEPRAEWVAGTLIGTPREMAAQAGHFRALRPDCKKPVWRCSISLPPSDGRQTLHKWESIATDFLREMGIPQNAAWCAIRHFERDHDHIHLTVLRTLPDGSLWNQEHSARRAIKVCEKLELAHNLNTHSRSPAPKDRPSRAEIEISKRKGTPMSRELIQDSVNSFLHDHPDGIDFEELQKLLAAKGVDIQPYAPGGVLKGVSYFCDGFKWPGSKIGREYSAGLTERGVRYAVRTSAQGLKPQQHEPEIAPPNPSHGADLVTPKAPIDQRRPPAMLVRVLQKNVPQNSLERQFDKPKPLFDLQQIQERELGRVSKSLLVLAAALANVGAELALAVIEFVKRLLAKLGVMLKPTEIQTYQHPQVGPLTFEPAPMLPGPAEGAAQSEIDAAAAVIEQVAEAVRLKSPEALPREAAGERLTQLLAEEAEDGGAVGGGAPPASADAGGASALDEIFSLVDSSHAPSAVPVQPASKVAAATPEGAPQKLWPAFVESFDRLDRAHQAVVKASRSPGALQQPSIDARRTALAEARAAITRLVDKARRHVEFISLNPLLQKERFELASKLDKLEARFELLLKDPVLNRPILGDAEALLRSSHDLYVREQRRREFEAYQAAARDADGDAESNRGAPRPM